MPIQHVNRRGQTYYLHEGKTKTGKPSFFFSQKSDGTLAKDVPDGFEVYENPNGQVFLRKTVPRLVTEAEIALVEQGIRDLADLPSWLIDVRGPSLVVYTPDSDVTRFVEELGRVGFGVMAGAEAIRAVQQSVHHSPMMRFRVVNAQTRQFGVDRMCFRGGEDEWFLLDVGDLKTLVAKYCPHLGQESFYELM